MYLNVYRNMTIFSEGRWASVYRLHYIPLTIIRRSAFCRISLLKKNCIWQRSLSRLSGAGMFAGRDVCYHICRRNHLFSLRQTVSNLCQSIFVFLTVSCVEIFKHSLESPSSIRSRLRFLCWRTKSTSKSSSLTDVLLLFLKSFSRDKEILAPQY